MGTCCDALTSIDFSFDPCNIYRDYPRDVPRGKQNVVKKRSFAHEYCWKPVTRHRYTAISQKWLKIDGYMLRGVLTSIELSFDACNIYRDCPRGVGYPAEARSVGDSHPCLYLVCCNPYMSLVNIDVVRICSNLSKWNRPIEHLKVPLFWVLTAL